MDNLNKITNDMKFLAKSEIRMKLISELNNQPNNVSGLVELTKITYSSVSMNIRKLEKHNYIKKIRNKYYVNPTTNIYFKTLMDFKNSIDMINDYDSFWDKHNLNQLSLNSIKQITSLKDADLIESTPIDIFKTHETIKNQLNNAHCVKAIFPYIHPEYPHTLENILKHGGKVELILPQNIFKELIFRINGNIRRMSLKNKQLKVHKYKKELNLYLAICDKNMSLGLFKTDGSFDQNRILVSNNKESYVWAKDLFNHIKTQGI